MDTFALIAQERRRLADVLDTIAPDDWDGPSLCAGWSRRVVAAHLNAPWEVGLPTVMLQIARSFGSIDKAFDTVAKDLARRLTPEQSIAGLRANAEHRFTPPGSGAEAPLTDVLVHGADILHPLERTASADPDALAVSLRWLARGKAKGFLPRSRVVGLSFEATDIGVRCGDGSAVVRGPALALCGALVGRRALLDLLSGDGRDVLAARI